MERNASIITPDYVINIFRLSKGVRRLHLRRNGVREPIVIELTRGERELAKSALSLFVRGKEGNTNTVAISGAKGYITIYAAEVCVSQRWPIRSLFITYHDIQPLRLALM